MQSGCFASGTYCVFFFTFSLPPASLDLKVPILAGKRDSRHYSTTCFMKNVLVEESSYQMLEVLTFCDREGTQTPSIKITAVTFLWKKSTIKISRVSIF